jgi:hypothetical protein
LATCAKTAQTALVVAFLGLGACKSAESADGVADAFVDAYYVEFDHARAKALSTAGALRRIEQEERLVADAREQMQVESRKARVYYSDPAKRQVRDDMVHYTYQLDVRASGSQRDQQVVVMLAKREGSWKVVQFREGDERAEQPTKTSTVREEP